MSVLLKVWGDYACFSRPELAERYSYDVMTPSAAIGILEAIYWHPGMYYKIDKIYVLNPIEFVTVWKNEVNDKISEDMIKNTIRSGDNSELYMMPGKTHKINQRSYTVLKNVCYIIKAHFEIGEEANETDNPGKFQDCLTRRIRKGQCYHRPYLGIREFPAKFEPYNEVESTIKAIGLTQDLGIMLYKLEYTAQMKDGEKAYEVQPTFFRAKIDNGVLNLDNCEVLK